MDIEIILLSEVRQIEKDKYLMIFLIFRIKIKRCKHAYLQNRNRFTDLEKKLMLTRGGRLGGEIE